ncbi:unnamed protein product [Arctogadus glacialis]
MEIIVMQNRAPGRRVGTAPLCFREPPGLNRGLPSGDKLSGFSTLDSGQVSQGRELCWPSAPPPHGLPSPRYPATATWSNATGSSSTVILIKR